MATSGTVKYKSGKVVEFTIRIQIMAEHDDFAGLLASHLIQRGFDFKYDAGNCRFEVVGQESGPDANATKALLTWCRHIPCRID